jgi:hypothetical protein
MGARVRRPVRNTRRAAQTQNSSGRWYAGGTFTLQCRQRDRDVSCFRRIKRRHGCGDAKNHGNQEIFEAQ